MHTYSRVSVWRGWDLARGSARGSACMFTCKDRGQSMDGKGWSYISASGLAVSQEWGRRCMFHRTWPSTEQGLYRTLYNQLLHHNRLRSHRSPEEMLRAVVSDDPNLTPLWTDNSITQSNTKKDISVICMSTIPLIFFQPSSFSK